MIKIIKDGSYDSLHSIKRFHCNKCGCIFDADDESYLVKSNNKNEFYITVNCPYCDELVCRNFEDFEA